MTVLSPGDASLLSSLARIVWVCIKYIHMRYWPSVRSKWLDVGRVLFFCVFMDFILPACAASYMIKWLTEQDIYWPIICYPISRSQVSTCCLFPAQEWNWTFELQYSTKIVSWWSNEPFFFFFFFSFSPLWQVHQFPNRSTRKTYILQFISSLYFIFCRHLFSPPWGEKMNR